MLSNLEDDMKKAFCELLPNNSPKNSNLSIKFLESLDCITWIQAIPSDKTEEAFL